MKTILKIWVLVIFFTLSACQKNEYLENQDDTIIDNSTSFKTSFEVESETLQAQLISKNNINPIHDHASVVFKDKIWIIGGHTNGEASNTILNSSDGVKWNTVKTRSIFSPRRGHSVVVFKNKLWVLGGSPNNNYGEHIDDMTFYNDTWSSSDGIEWEQNPYSHVDVFRGRIDFGTAIFKGEIWAFGGFSEIPCCNRIQKSSDGVNWHFVKNNLVTQDLIGNQAIAFDNKLWLVGGYNWGGNIFTASTSDGINWDIYDTDIPKYAHHQLVTDNKKMYLIAGDYVAPPKIYNLGESSNHIWHTSNGSEWFKAKASLNFPKRTRHSSVFYKYKFWVIGGSNDENLLGLSDVWTLTPIDPFTVDDLTLD